MLFDQQGEAGEDVFLLGELVLAGMDEGPLERRLQPEHLGIVRRDDKVRAAIRAQQSILNRAPDSAAAEDVKQIARRVRRGSAAKI